MTRAKAWRGGKIGLDRNRAGRAKLWNFRGYFMKVKVVPRKRGKYAAEA